MVFYCFQIEGFAQTQADMNQNTAQMLLNHKLKLDSINIQIKEIYRSDTTFLSAFRKSQNEWLEYLNAQMRMKYPKRPHGWYGSNHNMCIAIYKTELYKERIKHMSNWLNDPEEGDGCAGSIIK